MPSPQQVTGDVGAQRTLSSVSLSTQHSALSKRARPSSTTRPKFTVPPMPMSTNSSCSSHSRFTPRSCNELLPAPLPDDFRPESHLSNSYHLLTSLFTRSYPPCRPQSPPATTTTPSRTLPIPRRRMATATPQPRCAAAPVRTATLIFAKSPTLPPLSLRRLLLSRRLPVCNGPHSNETSFMPTAASTT